MEIGFKTDKGRVRSNNEDACYVIPRKNVFIVADGVGGSNSGEIASRTAVTEIAKYIETHDLDDSFDEEGIRAFFTERRWPSAPFQIPVSFYRAHRLFPDSCEGNCRPLSL